VAEEGIPYLEDPMNTSPRFLRARLRHDLLPLLSAHSPGFAEEMLAIAERAATWRREVERLLDVCGLQRSADGHRLTVPVQVLEQTTEGGRAVLWPAICARIGVTLDANGTRAAVRFTTSQRRGAHIEVKGGALILRRCEARGEVFEVRRRAPARETPSAWDGLSDALPPRFGRWRFRRLGVEPFAADAWSMALPAGAPVVVRTWAAGDRIRTTSAPAGRRVTRYFSESRVPVPDRPSWPIVLVNDEPAWVPGVCRALAAPSRPGRSDLIWYRCEREFD
jgi:tRNA(Ile)-lysidine synthase